MTGVARILVAGVLVTGVCASACDGPRPSGMPPRGDASAGAGPDAPVDVTDAQAYGITTNSAVVGPQGGTLTVGDVRLVVPPGALDSDVSLTGTLVSGQPRDVANGRLLGDVFTVTPEGITFRRPAALTMPLREPAAGAVLARIVEATPVTLEGLATRVAGSELTAAIDHFSSVGPAQLTDNCDPACAADQICCNGVCQAQTSDHCQSCQPCNVGNVCCQDVFSGLMACMPLELCGCVPLPGGGGCCPPERICTNAGGVSVCLIPPQVCCNGVPTNPQTDLNNCGTCGHACGPCETCAGGQCVSTCATGETCTNGMCAPPSGLCDGAIVDTMNDLNHCGGCGQRCPVHQVCSSGQCSCPVGEQTCGGNCQYSACGGGVCADLQFDPAHCGTCTSACAPNQGCLFGGCCGAGGFACSPAGGSDGRCCTGRCGAGGTCCLGVLNACTTPGTSGGQCCDGACGLQGFCCSELGQRCTPGYFMCCTGTCSPQGFCVAAGP